MKEKMVGLLIILVLFTTVFGIRFATVGDAVFDLPFFIVDTYAKMPDGSDITIDRVGAYLANNIWILNPVGLVADVSKIFAYGGNLPRYECQTELDRLVYFIYGAIGYTQGNKPNNEGYTYTYNLLFSFDNLNSSDTLQFTYDSNFLNTEYLNKSIPPQNLITGAVQTWYASVMKATSRIYLTTYGYSDDPSASIVYEKGYSNNPTLINVEKNFRSFKVMSSKTPVISCSKPFYVLVYGNTATSVFARPWKTFEAVYDGSKYSFTEDISWVSLSMVGETSDGYLILVTDQIPD